MKSIIASVCVVCAIANINIASACSYQIDQAKKIAELTKIAYASLEPAIIRTHTVNNFSFFESKPTPMCPEEMTYSADVSIGYEVGTTYCWVDLTVKKIESWGELDQDSYIVSGKKTARCNR
jgi:hypothetical protein